MAEIEPPSPSTSSPTLPSPELGRMTSMAAGRKGPPRLSGFFNVVSPRLSHSPGPSLLSSTRPPASLFFFFFWMGGGAVVLRAWLACTYRAGCQGRDKTLICCRASRQGDTSVTADDGTTGSWTLPQPAVKTQGAWTRQLARCHLTSRRAEAPDTSTSTDTDTKKQHRSC